MSITDDPVLKPRRDNGADKVAAIVQPDHGASVSWVRDLDSVRLGRRSKHDRPNTEDNASNDHVSSVESSGLDDGAEDDDPVGNEHSPFAAEAISEGASEERTKNIAYGVRRQYCRA